MWKIRGKSWLLILLLVVAGCTGNDPAEHGEHEHGEHAAQDDIIYICSMDPQVVQDRPGRCPICGMNLTPVQRQKQQRPGIIELSEQQMLLGGIVTDTIGEGTLSARQVFSGTLVTDPATLTSVSARVEGYIEKLYVRTTGEIVRKGTPLYRLYSPELYNTQLDLIRAMNSRDSMLSTAIDLSSIAQAARERLLLHGIGSQQIDRIVATGKATSSLNIMSPGSGVITELLRREGDAVMEGDVIMQLSALDRYWAEVQLYAYDSQIGVGTPATVTLPDGRTVSSAVDFVAPRTTGSSQLITARIPVEDPDHRYRPGNLITASFDQRSDTAITVPREAILFDGKGASAWVKVDERTFELRMLEIGDSAGGMVQVMHGIAPGEEVVVRGAYLISSEYTIRRGEGAHDHSM